MLGWLSWIDFDFGLFYAYLRVRVSLLFRFMYVTVNKEEDGKYHTLH